MYSSSEMGANQEQGGSEDFAYISRAVPSVMLALAAGNSKDGYTFPLHHPRASFDENALSIGSALYAAVALNFLKNG